MTDRLRTIFVLIFPAIAWSMVGLISFWFNHNHHGLHTGPPRTTLFAIEVVIINSGILCVISFLAALHAIIKKK